VAAVKSRPVLHHCVVIFFWSSGIMECTCMLFTFENGVPLMRYGASAVWHQSLPLMNSFNKTGAAVFSCRLCFLRDFPFISLINLLWSRLRYWVHFYSRQLFAYVIIRRSFLLTSNIILKVTKIMILISILIEQVQIGHN